jgi:hypothetical protein
MLSQHLRHPVWVRQVLEHVIERNRIETLAAWQGVREESNYDGLRICNCTLRDLAIRLDACSNVSPGSSLREEPAVSRSDIKNLGSRRKKR